MAERIFSDPPPEIEFFSSRQVVITGMGMISPLGLSVDSSWQRLIAGESGFSSKKGDPRFEQIKASVFGIVEEFDADSALGDIAKPKDLRRLSRSSQFSLSASLEALKHACLLTEDYRILQGVDLDRFGVQIGTGIGGAVGLVDVQKEIDNGKRVSPLEVLTITPERVSAVPSKWFGLKGPIETPSAACATGNIAIVGGYKEIVLNQADIMLVGGVEASIEPVAVKLFDAIPALSREDDPNIASRPFDEARDGFVYSEGAGILVIESEEHAIRRGAHILAYIGGYGNTADAFHETAPSGEGARRAMKLALKGAHGAKSIYVNAHGTATVEGDPVEMRAVKESILDTFDELAISSTKGATGHTLGAAGGIEAIFCVKALETGVLPPTIHHEHTMPEAKDVNIVPNKAQEKSVDVAMNNSFGFGGINSVITLFKADSA